MKKKYATTYQHLGITQEEWEKAKLENKRKWRNEYQRIYREKQKKVTQEKEMSM